MKSPYRYLLALLSALLLSIPFTRWGSGVVLMFAFIPLLFVEDDLYRSAGKKRSGSLIWCCMLTFALFVILTTYWVKHAAWVGVIASVIVNTGYMTLTFWLFHFTRKKLGDRLGYAGFVVYWITFEFLYLRATINFPWLVLGNGFAKDIMLIQWYEWTGTLGGTLWVLLMNLMLFHLAKGWLRNRSFRKNRGHLSRVVAILLVPILFSLIRYISYEETEDPCEIVVIQPNIDPYLKFSDMPQEEQTFYLLQIADSLATQETDYFVGPETFLNNSVWEGQIDKHREVLAIRRFLSKYPDAKMVLGATTLKLYSEPAQYTPTSQPIRGDKYRYDSFNSAFQLDSTDRIPIYHKSLLVVGVEHMPYTRLLGFMKKLTVQLGGTFRSHGTQDYRDAFVSPQDGTRVGPVICWESVFGEYVTDYVKEAGADFLFVITNDGWWKNTAGHRQHNSYARLRAIETRRSIARSANTGISSFINQRGEELQRLGWWQRSGLRGTLNKNDQITFYVKYGDYLGRIGLFLSVILLLYGFVKRFIKT